MITVIPLVMFLLGTPVAAQEKDYSNSPLNNWYKSLKQNDSNLSCCDISDCGPYTSKIVDDHYEILIEDRWVRVPDNVILKDKDNPTGEAVACFKVLRAYPGDPNTGISWYCFVPPILS